MTERVVLASRSPRRTALLSMLGIPHTVDPSAIDENVRPGERPEDYALRVARAKAADRARVHAGRFVIGADTTVVIGDDILGKPADAAEAVVLLRLLAGRTHRVLSAVAVAHENAMISELDETRVSIATLDQGQIADYVATGEPLDKAGAYGIQGFGAALVDRIEGDFCGVMGLPLRIVLRLLDRVGYHYSFTR